MLKMVLKVSEALRKQCAPADLTLEQITTMFRNMTAIDRIGFTDYDTPEANPIWGVFTRWVEQPKPYVSPETVVVVRYARHLRQKLDWLRFVVTKELCHALEAPAGEHDVSNRSIIDLVSTFSVMSHQRPVTNPTRVFNLEMLAEIAAIEILCPIDERREYLNANGVPDAAAVLALSTKYTLPPAYIEWSFQPENIQAVADLIEQG